jgi:hypothetical protein
VNWSDKVSSSNSAEGPNPSGDLLYLGDRGDLPLDTRRAMVQLLSGPSLEMERHGKLWPVLVRDEDIIRRRLSDLFLELVIDREAGVAFTRQADAGDVEVPLLLRRSQLTFIDSVVLLNLRQKLAQAEARGERAVVSGSELVEELAVFEPAAGTDHAGFARRIRSSIEKFKDRSILQKIRMTDDRYEVSPTLRLLFSAERVEALSRLYKQMAESSSLETPFNEEASTESESWPSE